MNDEPVQKPIKPPGLVLGVISAMSWLGGPSLGDLIDDVVNDRRDPWDRPKCVHFKRKKK